MSKDTRFDWLYTFALLTTFAGGIVDGWAHSHIPEQETFFSLTHAMLYGGLLLILILLGSRLIPGLKNGIPWKRTVPPGYHLAYYGAGLFLLAGLGDVLWHEVFGFETMPIEILTSPTHQLLFLGGIILGYAAFHSGWIRHRMDASMPRYHMPMYLGLAVALGMIMYATQANHFTEIIPAWSDPLTAFGRDAVQTMGVTTVLLQSMLISSVLIFALRRRPFPPGALTLVIGVSVASIALIKEEPSMVWMAFIGATAVDSLNSVLRPEIGKRFRLALFAGSAPLLFFLIYYAMVIPLYDTWWPVHVWTGSLVYAALGGVLPALLTFGERREADAAKR